VAEAAVEKLKSNELPELIFKYGGLDPEDTEIQHFVADKQVDKKDGDIGEEQPFHDRREPRQKAAALWSVPMIISIRDAHVLMA
jgi:hypothetical protein